MSEEQLKGLPVNLYSKNPDTDQWESAQLNKLLTDILAKLEEIRILLGGV